MRETINRGTAIIRENKVCITWEPSILKKKYLRIFLSRRDVYVIIDVTGSRVLTSKFVAICIFFEGLL